MTVNESQRREPSFDAARLPDQVNPFAPPRSPVELKPRSPKLLPHQRAGRVIRLIAWLAVVVIVGIGAAVLLPAISTRGAFPLGLLIMLGFMAAFAVGLLFVAGAVMRHQTWGRVAGIVYGLISLAGFPIGTIIGLYVLWHLVFGWSEVEVDA